MQGRALTKKRMTRTHQGNIRYTTNAPSPNETMQIIEWARIQKKPAQCTGFLQINLSLTLRARSQSRRKLRI